MQGRSSRVTLGSVSLHRRSNWYGMTRKKVVWTIIAVAAAAVIGLLLLLRAHRLRLVHRAAFGAH